jgi:WD repeat-containing protein 81
VGGGVAPPGLLRSLPLPREGAQGLRVLRDCLLMTSGASVGVLALPGGGLGADAWPAVSSPGAAGGGGGIAWARLRNARGGRESAAVTGLAALPCCRLLLVSGEDGVVRVCK